MQAQILLLVAFAILLWLAFRDRKAGSPASRVVRRWLHTAALILMVLYAAFFALFGFGEIFGGDISGVIHLLPMLIIPLLAWIARRLPFESGLVLAGLGVVTIAVYTVPMMRAWNGVLLLGLPWLVIGLVLLAAVGLAPRHPGPASPGLR